MATYVLANHGEYISAVDKEWCMWTFIPALAKTFDTYQQAYNAMRKVNKLYGRKRCYVQKYD